MSEVATSSPRLFNSEVETGIRSLVLLDAAYPRCFDLGTLTLLDHLVVHTRDIGGPESLHPSIPQRTGELLIRRQLVEAGLLLMRRLHLVDVRATDNGLFYIAGDDAESIVSLMRSQYSMGLKNRASWLIDYVGRRDLAEFGAEIARYVDRWATEFQELSAPGSAPP